MDSSAFDLTLGYNANRKRSEFLFFTLTADAQPIITDPLITEDTEVLSIQTSNLSHAGDQFPQLVIGRLALTSIWAR